MLLEDAIKGYPGTREGLTRAICDYAPLVRGVRWRILRPGIAEAAIILPWWAWIALGALHRRAVKRAEQAMKRWGPAAAVILVRRG